VLKISGGDAFYLDSVYMNKDNNWFVTWGVNSGGAYCLSTDLANTFPNVQDCHAALKFIADAARSVFARARSYLRLLV